MQIGHIVSHLPTKEMTKFRWLFKLGISVKEWTQLNKEGYTPEKFKQLCKSIPLKQLAILYIYIWMCNLALFQKVQFSTQKD
jgi:hypothetical protein